MRPTSGNIAFEGRRIEGRGMHETFGLGLVRTFQIPREMQRMTVMENLMLVPARQMGEKLVGVVVPARKGCAGGAPY